MEAAHDFERGRNNLCPIRLDCCGAFVNFDDAPAGIEIWLSGWAALFECYPLGPDRTRYAWVNCFPRSTVSRSDYARVAPGYHERWDIAVIEDDAILERQQRGLASPFARPGRLQPRKEPIVAHFGRWLADRVIGNVPAVG